MVDANGASTETDYAIDACGITKSFNGKVVVNALDMRVRRGEIFGFLGPNGSGKTTFIRMLCGLLKPDSGTGTCLGRDLIRDQREIKKRVGYMTQKFSYYEDLTVYENMDFVARLHGISRRRQTIEAMMDKMNLLERRDQLAGELSGGWKQRLALAACLLHDPELLLLDEPTAGVDPKSRRSFWEIVHQLADERGITALITTHYMDEAERCHRLAYLAYGELLASGTPESVVADSGLTVWKVTGPNPTELAEKLRALPDVEQVVAFGEALHVAGTDADKLSEAIRPFQGAESCWEAVAPSLEDAFIHLMANAKDNF